MPSRISFLAAVLSLPTAGLVQFHLSRGARTSTYAHFPQDKCQRGRPGRSKSGSIPCRCLSSPLESRVCAPKIDVVGQDDPGKRNGRSGSPSTPPPPATSQVAKSCMRV